MITRLLTVIAVFILIIGTSYCQQKSDPEQNSSQVNGINDYAVSKSENEWKAILSPEEFNVLREKGTEYAFSGEYYDFKGKGIYVCAGCGNELFDSKTKYDSKSGWPSFYAPINKQAVNVEIDKSFGMTREEVVCAKCGGHLGHVFKDGPRPTGQRYCINSVSLDFEQK